MQFVRPEYLWLVWIVPLVTILWGIGIWYQRRVRLRFGNIENLESISRISWSGRGWSRGILFMLSLVVMALALAQPRVISRELRPIPTPTDIIFLLDMSPSMYARDMDPSRLRRAEQIIEKFLQLKQSQDRYGVVAFNHTAIVLSYLTTDPQSILLYFEYLNRQNEPEPATNMGAAMVSAWRIIETDREFDPKRAAGRRNVWVLLSDGDDTIGLWPEVLPAVIAEKIVIYSFGFGSANGAPVPLVLAGGLQGQVLKYLTNADGTRILAKAQDRTMRDIADYTGGKFYRAESNRQVDAGLDEILFQARPIAGYETSPVPKELFHYFLWSAFACLLIGIFFPL